MADTEVRALDWDSAIENDGGGMYDMLEPGTYTFKVIEMARERFGGSPKTPPCPQASLTIELYDTKGNIGRAFDNILLSTNAEWKLCQFFTAIGQRKHGERLVPNWDKVVGASGTCQVGKDTYTKDGQEREKNVIKRYLEPVDTTPKYAEGHKPWNK